MEISHRLGHLDPLTEGNFARVLIELGRPGEALPLAEHALRSLPRVADSTLRGSIAFFGAPAWCETGDTARCAALLRQARDIFAATPPQEKAAIPNLRMHRAMLLERQGALAGAREEMRRAAEELEGLRNHIAPRAYALLARLELQAGEPAEAQAHAEKAIALAQTRGTGYDNTAWHGSALLSLGLVQKAQGEPAARETLAAALAELRDACGEAAPETQRARAALTG
jgi:tetratricopeptide (TPR) repeat protein